MTRLLPLLVLVEATAVGQPADRCRADTDCRFAFRTPCFCPPCGEARRTAQTVAAHDRIQSSWAIKVPHCRPCARCKTPTDWRGTRAVCRDRACVVVGESPTPLRSLVNARIGAVVYTLEVTWGEGGFAPRRFPGMPHHHSSRFQWHGLAAGLKGKAGETHHFDFIITRREIQKVPGQRRWWATYHADVVKVR